MHRELKAFIVSIVTAGLLLVGPAAYAAFQLEYVEEAEHGKGIVGQLPTTNLSVASPDSNYPHHSQGHGSSCYTEPGTPPAEVLQGESKYNPRAENPISSASGCWQFIDSTWGGYGGYAHASQAPVWMQNERAKQLWDGGRGCSHWSQTSSAC